MVTLDAWQSHETKRLGLKEYLAQSPNREAWHRVAQKAIEATDGEEEWAVKVFGLLASMGREDSVDLLDHVKSEVEDFDTSDNQKVKCFFTRLWGPCVISDFKQEQNGGKEDE